MTSSLAAFQKRIANHHGQRIAWSSKDVQRLAAHFGVDLSHADLPHQPRQAAGHMDLRLKDAASDGRTFNFIASTSDVDRMGDTINQAGWQLAAFRRSNPTILFAHDAGSLPVGKSISTSIQGNQLHIGVRFAQTALGRAVAALVSGGFMKATSVGFRPLDYEFAKSPSRKNGIDFKSAELLEVSIVPIPANPNCLLTGIASADGKALTSAKAKALTSAKAKRQRELDVILVGLDDKTRRLVEVAALRRKSSC